MKIYRIIFFVLIVSCNSKEKIAETDSNRSISNIANETKTTFQNKIIEGDPSFVNPKDTISLNGPQSITRNIFMDKKGKLWFATWEGIIKYDGKYFTNVTLKENLNRFHIQTIFEDSKGNLWFGTIDGGVIFFDGQNYGYFTKKDGLSGDKVFCFIEDKSGSIWIGTNEGASCYNGKTFFNFSKQHGLSDNFIYSIAQDNTGRIWFATNNGISYCSERILLGQEKFIDFHIDNNHSFHTVRSIFNDKNGNVLIASQEGLYRYTPVTNETDRGKLAIISPSMFMNIFEDKSGNLWLSGSNNNSKMMTLLKYDGKTFSEIANHIQVFGVCEDLENNIWYGTERGAFRLDRKQLVNS
jgi:ligand-binding sensor domain-containing protein